MLEHVHEQTQEEKLNMDRLALGQTLLGCCVFSLYVILWTERLLWKYHVLNLIYNLIKLA